MGIGFWQLLILIVVVVLVAGFMLRTRRHRADDE